MRNNGRKWFWHLYNSKSWYSWNNRRSLYVAYWSSYLDSKNPQGNTFSESNFSNWIKIGNTGLYNVEGLKINIHPWPYYGCLYGDGFARAFRSTDHFELLIYGVDQYGVVTAPIVHTLADYSGYANSMDRC